MQIVINRRTKEVDKVGIHLKDVEFEIYENDNGTLSIEVFNRVGTDVSKLEDPKPVITIIPLTPQEVLIGGAKPTEV